MLLDSSLQKAKLTLKSEGRKKENNNIDISDWGMLD